MNQPKLTDQPPPPHEPQPLTVTGGELRGFNAGSWAHGEIEIERPDGARFKIRCEVLAREVERA